jgi:AcrR family transcriptional regulator
MTIGSARSPAKPADTRARILEAARQLFGQKGSAEVTVAEVAALAEVSRATVFNQFGSKRALVDAVTEGVYLGYDMMLERALEHRDTAVPLLVRALFRYMGGGIEMDGRFYRSVFREIARVNLGLDEGGVAWQAYRRAMERLVHLLTRGQARGELHTTHDPQLLATAFDSLVFGTITHWLYEDDSEPLTIRMLGAADVFLGPVASDPTGASEPLPDLTVESPHIS